jgi:hypothetical protein
VPATVRYTVTSPNDITLLDQPLNVNLRNGGSFGSIPFTIDSTAVSGTYTFQATITYQDNDNVTQASSLTTNFDIGDGPAALPAVTSWQPFVYDINGITRTSFSPGEVIFLNRVIYSSFTTSVTGTVRYRITGLGASTLMDQTITATFSPGLNTSYLGVTTNVGVPPGAYTFVMTVTAQDQTSTSSSMFFVVGGGAPPLD